MDCYIFAVLDRLKGLRNQLCTRPNIDGMIVLNIDHFLLERQRKHDPVGYAVFGNVEAVVQNAVAAEHLEVDGATDGRIHGSSILRLDTSRPDTEAADPVRVREALTQVQDWAQGTPGPDLGHREGTRLGDRVSRSAEGNGSLGRPVSRSRRSPCYPGREDWASRHADSDQERAHEGGEDFVALVRLVRPDQGFEDRDRWEALKRKIADRIAGLDRQQRVLERLVTVFDVLVQAIEEGVCLPADSGRVDRAARRPPGDAV